MRDRIPASAIGEPASAVTLNVPRWSPAAGTAPVPERCRAVAECFPASDQTSRDPSWPALRRCSHIPSQYSHAPFAPPKLPRPIQRWGVRLGDAGDLSERFGSHTPPDLGEGGALGITQPQSRWQLRPHAEQPILLWPPVVSVFDHWGLLAITINGDHMRTTRRDSSHAGGRKAVKYLRKNEIARASPIIRNCSSGYSSAHVARRPADCRAALYLRRSRPLLY